MLQQRKLQTIRQNHPIQQNAGFVCAYFALIMIENDPLIRNNQ